MNIFSRTKYLKKSFDILNISFIVFIIHIIMGVLLVRYSQHLSNFVSDLLWIDICVFLLLAYSYIKLTANMRRENETQRFIEKEGIDIVFPKEISDDQIIGVYDEIIHSKNESCKKAYFNELINRSLINKEERERECINILYRGIMKKHNEIIICGLFIYLKPNFMNRILLIKRDNAKTVWRRDKLIIEYDDNGIERNIRLSKKHSADLRNLF